MEGMSSQCDRASSIHHQRERGPRGYGIGAHYCLSAPLALLEGAIGLAILLARLPNLRLHPGYPTAPYRHEFRATPTLYVQG